jgi:protein-tyrosine-phosphatase
VDPSDTCGPFTRGVQCGEVGATSSQTGQIHQSALTHQVHLMHIDAMSRQQPHPDVAPPEFLQLAGHPLRWRLLSELARSDRMVHELTGLVGEPQNLVSYHLGKLRDGRLVSARRSSADRRDSYYALDLPRIGGLLSATGGALHAGLRLTPPSRDDAPIRPARVLFLCTGNSARSQIAEAMARARSGGAIEAVSAGSHPKPLHPNAVRVMRDEYGLDVSAQTSKPLDLFAGQRFDWVISLCDRVREVCPKFPDHPEVIHWSIANPATDDPDDITYPLFRQTAAELAIRIEFLLAALAERTPLAKSPGDTHVRPQ